MKTTLYFVIVILLASCVKSPPESLKADHEQSEDYQRWVMELYDSRPLELAKTLEQAEMPEICFSAKDIKICKKCMNTNQGYFARNGNFCISHYDYTNNEAEVTGLTDRLITQTDLDFVMNHICQRSYSVNKDLPANALDLVPAVNPFINEACATTWDNLTAVVGNGNPNYFLNWPEWTADPNDVNDKSRYTFFWEVKTPSDWPEADSLPYTLLEIGWYLLPISDYGNTGLVCMGLQELRCWIYDEYTQVWYFNSQIVNASVLCDEQEDCNNGFTFDQLEYADYGAGFQYDTISPW